ncbi:uncharacterized protein LOC124690887 [Lolium rigidum]|uniref:uncharacterized protein LOC124690887 n=1 Tax=Lolium rigidum TaxID=89674 RepID=UPI001F5C63B8|nr:uncharacterized protein LOC124690887 [Lolium rigidum]
MATPFCDHHPKLLLVATSPSSCGGDLSGMLLPVTSSAAWPTDFLADHLCAKIRIHLLPLVGSSFRRDPAVPAGSAAAAKLAMASCHHRRRDRSMMGTKLCSSWSSKRGPGGWRDGWAQPRRFTPTPLLWRWRAARERAGGRLPGCCCGRPCGAKAFVFPDLQLQSTAGHVPNLLLLPPCQGPPPLR